MVFDARCVVCVGYVTLGPSCSPYSERTTGCTVQYQIGTVHQWPHQTQQPAPPPSIVFCSFQPVRACVSVFACMCLRVHARVCLRVRGPE